MTGGETPQNFMEQTTSNPILGGVCVRCGAPTYIGLTHMCTTSPIRGMHREEWIEYDSAGYPHKRRS